MLRKLYASILLITNICIAQDKIEGHIKPLQSELLSNPVTLSCGVVIIENVEKNNRKIRSVELSERDINTLNVVCLRVVSKYRDFIASHNMGNASSSKFYWTVSLLPDTKDYRCMNDTKYRFKHRVINEGNVPVDGYTDAVEKHTFSLSNRNSKFFKTVFAHEIFHAMNMFYGINDTEELAELFTEQLGYGR